MAKFEFDKETFEAWKAAQKESLELQQKMNSSVGGYLEALKKIKELQKNIQFIEQKVAELKQEQAKAENDLIENTKKLNKAEADGNDDEIKALKEKEKQLNKILAAKNQGVAITEKELGLLKQQNDALVESAKQANLMSAGFGSAIGFLGKVPGLITKGFGMLKNTGVFEMDKEIRNAVRSMAGGKKEYNGMLNTITEAANTTTMWGVGVKDLAIMQRGYSEEIGKSVALTESGFKAMAGIVEGTGLGREFAVQIAGGMDKFNMSATQTGKLVENTMNIAGKMGVNGAAAMKSLQSNLKLAQRFNFKNGIAGLAKLTVEATRLKLDLNSIAGLADKVFRPEGAIETAAKLTTMGGEFAKLGDPMQLMFKARNDFAGFSKDIGKATAEFVEFNKENGTYEMKGGLAADRMREISQITGIEVEKLQEMAVAQKKMNDAQVQLKGGTFDKDDAETIASLSEFDEKTGKFKISLNGVYKNLNDLRQTDLKSIVKEKEKLEQRAKDARTFDETLQDLILLFKQQLLPFAQELKDGLGTPIQDMVAQWKKEGFFKTLKEFVTGAAKIAVHLGKFILGLGDFIKGVVNIFGVKGVIYAGLTLALAGKAITWISNGMLLAKGFNIGTGGMGGGGGMPGMSGGKGFGVPGGQIGPALPMSRAAKFSKFMGGAGGAGVLAAGFAGYDEYSENAAMGMSGGENAGRTTSKAAGAGLGAWGGAAAGAAIGTAALPVIGTAIGGLIGAAIGAWGGSAAGEAAGDAVYGNERNTKSAGIVSSVDPKKYNVVNDGVVFHPQDKFMKVNNATMIAGTQAGGNAKLAKTLSSDGSSGKVSHKFEELKIKVEINAPSDEKVWREIFNSPEIMRRFTQEIHIASESAASGGKVTGSGPKRRGKK